MLLLLLLLLVLVMLLLERVFDVLTVACGAAGAPFGAVEGTVDFVRVSLLFIHCTRLLGCFSLRFLGIFGANVVVLSLFVLWRLVSGRGLPAFHLKKALLPGFLSGLIYFLSALCVILAIPS